MKTRICGLKELPSLLEEMRKHLETAFSPDTAFEGTPDGPPSAGHCAAVAAILRTHLAGDYVSTTVKSHTHWFNRVRIAGKDLDIDLTGDQFGRPVIQVAKAGSLYTNSRLRSPEEVGVEALCRARLLAERAQLIEATDALERELKSRVAKGKLDH